MERPRDERTAWQEYCAAELRVLTPILERRGYVLADEQQHLKGERFLMQAVTTTSGKKLILVGRDAAGAKVVIKATRDAAGKREIEHERVCRRILKEINFAAETFHTPREVAYLQQDGLIITVQEFIEQERTFLERPVEEQFALALSAFKAQEGTHATTYQHRKRIRRAYGIRDAAAYLRNFTRFIDAIKRALPKHTDLHALFGEAHRELDMYQLIIEQYSGFLTHTDLVPHNFRITNGTIYLLDHSSLTFGNKYEGWARFVNFMTLYNQPLQEALEQYVVDNRSHGEIESLRLMRIYRLGEIILYYTRTLERSSGNLHTLNTARIGFWSAVLEAVLKREPVPQEVIGSYQKTRDSLRSDDEKARQQGLH